MNRQLSYKKTWLLYLLLLASVFAYYWLCYKTERENFLQVFALFTLLFACCYFIIRYFSISHFNQLMIAGILLRMLLLFAVPNLSDDVYRFIWDGRLAANGINPYSWLPAEVIQLPPITGLTTALYNHLNSQHYYTIYPPVLQGIFWITAKLFPENIYASVVCMKSIILLAEAGNIFLLTRLLQKLQLPKQISLLYMLNPLIIAELTGNVHFDAGMIFFLLLSFLLLLQKNLYVSALFFGISIATKLVPVVFLPLLISKLGWKKGFIYSMITGAVTVILFAAFLDTETIQHFLNSADLFFSHFEFNASFYYIIRWLGELITGFNIIKWAGPLLSAIALVIIFFISFYNRNISMQQFFIKALFIITIWYFFSTTVHPWYVCLPMALSIFTQYKYALVWSYVTTLSYYAYHSTPVKENLPLVAFSYLLVIGYGCLEVRIRNNKLKNTFQQNIS